MEKVTPELIRAQALALRISSPEEERAEALAADMTRLYEAVLAARERLDFNEEPARFAALLAAASAVPPGKKR